MKFRSLLAAATLAAAALPVASDAAVTSSTVGSVQRIRYPAGREPALALPGGERLTIRSLFRITKPMRFGDFAWNDAGVPDGAVRVRIDLARQMMSVFRNGHEIGTAVVLYGTDHKPTPTGTFPILARAEHHRSSLYDAEMPYMLRLTNDGVAIHASPVKRGYATHGCVGVPIDFARLLFAATRRGDRVTIVAG